MAWSRQARQAALVARKRRKKVGDLYQPTVNKRTGQINQKMARYTVYDSEHNRRKRRKAKIIGAAVGTAILPGAGTLVGLQSANAHIARKGYGYTTEKYKGPAKTRHVGTSGHRPQTGKIVKHAKPGTKSHGAAVGVIPKKKTKKRR